MANVLFGLRIEGAKDAGGRVHRFNDQSLQDLQKAAKDRADQTVNQIRIQMATEYTSKWAQGRLARGVRSKVEINGNGVDVEILIPEYRELRYVTSLLQGHFQNFPVRPFAILPVTRKALLIPFPNPMARQFIRGKGGRFAGSLGGGEDGPRPGILVKRVLWGRRTGGFARDVLRDVAESEGALFVDDMIKSMQGSINIMTT